MTGRRPISAKVYIDTGTGARPVYFAEPSYNDLVSMRASRFGSNRMVEGVTTDNEPIAVDSKSIRSIVGVAIAVDSVIKHEALTEVLPKADTANLPEATEEQKVAVGRILAGDPLSECVHLVGRGFIQAYLPERAQYEISRGRLLWVMLDDGRRVALIPDSQDEEGIDVLAPAPGLEVGHTLWDNIVHVVPGIGCSEAELDTVLDQVGPSSERED